MLNWRLTLARKITVFVTIYLLSKRYFLLVCLFAGRDCPSPHSSGSAAVCCQRPGESLYCQPSQFIKLVGKDDFIPVLRIRIRIRIQRIHMFLGLLDPDPSIIMQNSKKNLNSYYFVTLLDFLSLKNDVASKSNKQKKLC
jgi:hypothetical protein